VLLIVHPGSTLDETFLVPEDAAPGEYRLVKTFSADFGPKFDARAAAGIIVTA
jgi:hypothetical protein